MTLNSQGSSSVDQLCMTVCQNVCLTCVPVSHNATPVSLVERLQLAETEA